MNAAAQAADTEPTVHATARGVSLTNERSQRLRRQERDQLLGRIRSLIEHGAAGLALRLIDDRQPDPEQELVAWREWEFERVRSYVALKDYGSLVARVDVLPDTLSKQDRLQLLTFGAEAELSLGSPERARRRLRSLIFSDGPVDKKTVDVWRRLVIQAYIDERRFDDARTAMLKLDAESPVNDWAWLRLKSRVLLLAGDEAAAIALIKGRDEIEARLLVTLARFRSGVLGAADARERIEQIRALAASSQSISSTAVAMSWMIEAEINNSDGEFMNAARAFERRATIDTEAPDILASFDTAKLWRAWRRAAEQIVAMLNLPSGAHEAWIEAAELLVDGDLVAARALYAAVVLDSDDYRIRSEAHSGLISTLLVDPASASLALKLYTASSDTTTRKVQQTGLDELAIETRLKLSDAAIAAQDMVAAAQLLRGIDRAPMGLSDQAWALRRARIAVYAGGFKEGARLLQRLVDENDSMSAETMDQLLQPVFDLQSLDEHELALPILRRSLYVVDEPRFQYEIPFWSAQSAAALGRHAESAELFLRSAEAASDQVETEHASLWRLSAETHAAEQMALAGLPGDARRLYQRLLNELDDDTRRADIEHRMQKLYVVEAAKLRDDAR